MYVVVQQIAGTFSSYKYGTQYPLDNNSFPSPPSPWQPSFYFLFLNKFIICIPKSSPSAHFLGSIGDTTLHLVPSTHVSATYLQLPY